MGEFDDLTKTLVGANPQHLVSYLCPGAQYIERVDLVTKEVRYVTRGTRRLVGLSRDSQVWL